MNSRTLRLAVLFSALFHLGLVLFFYYWRFTYTAPAAEETADVEFLKQLVPQLPEPVLPRVTANTGARQVKRQEGRSHPAVTAPEIVLPTSQAPASGTVIWPAELDSLLAVADSVAGARQVATYSVPDFFPVPIPLVPYREERKPRRPVLFPMERLTWDPGAFTDRAAEEQRRSSGSGAGPVDLAALAARGVQALEKALKKDRVPPPPRIRKMPSREEMAALCAIWKMPEPTEHDIYKDLDPGLQLTAEDLHRVLSGLVDQGLLNQEIISPRNEFTFMTPLGSKGVEMSRLNVLNRVYRYHSRIDQEHMMRYLQAAHYYISTTARPDSAALCAEIRGHIRQIMELAPASP